MLVRYLGKQFAKKPLPTLVCKRANYSEKVKNKPRKKCNFVAFAKHVKKFCSRGFCHTYGVKCCLCVVTVRYLRQTSATKTLCQFPCAKGQITVQKVKNKLGKIFFQCKKRQTADFFFLLLRFSFCKNIKVKTIIIFLKMRL